MQLTTFVCLYKKHLESVRLLQIALLKRFLPSYYAKHLFLYIQCCFIVIVCELVSLHIFKPNLVGIFSLIEIAAKHLI